MSTKFQCSNCNNPFPESILHRCPACGGTFEINGRIVFEPDQIEVDLPGIWKYRHSFGLPKNAQVLSLGEGNTPLIRSKAFGSDVYFKAEYQNPTGSFKDRLTSPEISYLQAKGISEAVDDSSGNAGASFAAYIRRAEMVGKVFVPSSASGPKRKQISNYGISIEEVPGPRSAASSAVERAVKNGATYASHAYLPFGIPGIATLAYELVEQLGKVPGSVIAPVGHGSLVLGIFKGFEAMMAQKIIENIPLILGVQAKACAPIYSEYMGVSNKSKKIFEGETLAEGVRVLAPAAGETLISLAKTFPIQFVAVQEENILTGRDQLASMGFYVEATSAIVWDALEQTFGSLPKPVVVILTGSGLKS